MHYTSVRGLSTKFGGHRVCPKQCWPLDDLWPLVESLWKTSWAPSLPLAKFRLHTSKHDETHSRTYIHTPITPPHTLTYRVGFLSSIDVTLCIWFVMPFRLNSVFLSCLFVCLFFDKRHNKCAYIIVIAFVMIIILIMIRNSVNFVGLFVLNLGSCTSGAATPRWVWKVSSNFEFSSYSWWVVIRKIPASVNIPRKYKFILDNHGYMQNISL